MAGKERIQPFPFKREIMAPDEGAIPVVRIFPVTMPTIAEFRDMLDGDAHLEHSSLMRIVLAEKASTSVPSPGMITPLGGKVNANESPGHAAFRKLAEETLLYTTSPFAAGFSEKKFASCFFARVPHKDPKYAQYRETYFDLVPVAGATFLLQEPRDEDEEGPARLSRLLLVTLDEFRGIYETGSYLKDGRSIPAVEYIVKGDTTAAVGREQSDVRDSLMEDIFSRVLQQEQGFRLAMLKSVNRVRRARRFMFHQEIPLASSFADCSKEELETAFLAAQMQDMFISKANASGEHAYIKSPRAVDITKFARFLSEVPPELTFDLLVSAPTPEIYAITRRMRTALFDSLHAIDPKMDAASFNEGWYDALKTKWQEILSLPLDQRVETIRAWDKAFVEHCAEQFGIPKHVLEHAFRLAHAYDEYVTNSMQALGAQFQQHRPMNEVTNARFLPLVLLGLGLPMDINPDDIPKNNPSVHMMRFEAYRTLATTITAIRALEIEYFADSMTIESLVNTFLQFPPEEIVVHLGGSIFHRVVQRLTKDPVFDGKPVSLIIDERAMKDPLSIMRKLAFGENIDDIFSINLVISGEQFAADDDPTRIFDCLDAVVNSFASHCRQQLEPSGWKVSFDSSGSPSLAREKVVRYLNASLDQEREQLMRSLRTGKRPGSIGELILRQKYKITLTDPKGRSFPIEVSFYPFQRISAVSSLQGSGFLGFEEKLEDDATGGYSARRLINRDHRHPELPSAYELRYPPEIYGWHAPLMKRHQLGESD